MNRVEIKEEAKKIIKGKLWDFWKPALLVALISFAISFVVGLVLGIADVDTELSTSIASSIASFILIPVTVGMLSYILKMARGEEYSLSNLKEYYPFFIKIILIDLLVSILVCLGCVLLIIPGIILALGYTMVYFCFIDNNDIGVTEVLKTSREMMKGYKWDYFVFILSFFGWYLLIALTFGIAAIYVAPYASVAQALYYDKLPKNN